MDRKCPLCEQIVPSHVKGVEIVNLGKRKVFHQGCARLIHRAFLDSMAEMVDELIDQEEKDNV